MLLSRRLLSCVIVVAGAAVMALLLSRDVAWAGCPTGTEASPGFRTYLPDCRAYELVTPPDKQGALVEPVPAATVKADGSSLAGASSEAFAGITNGELFGPLGLAYYRFTRAGSGWVTVPLNPFRGSMKSIGLDDSVWGPIERPGPEPRLRVVHADASVSEVGPVLPGESKGELPFAVVAAANDASRGILFAITDASMLWSFDTTLSAPSLYQYSGTGNTAPNLVGVSGGVGSTALISQCGTMLGAPDGQREYNAVSEDGSTVFLTAIGADAVNCGGTEPPASELFARIGGSRTVAVSEPPASDCPTCNTAAPMDARYEGASADGSKVFFTTAQPLLGTDTSLNLYEYNFTPPPGQAKVVRVSAGDSTVSNPMAEVQGVSRISLDGSHVYFVARGVLSTAPNNNGHGAEAGADNLYLYERDTRYPGGRTVFIAQLCSNAGMSGAVADSQCTSNLNGLVETSEVVNDVALWGLAEGGGDERRPAQVTPDGRFLVFTSYAQLTEGDKSTAAQVFRYDAQTGQLARISFGQGADTTGSDYRGRENASIVTQAYGVGSGSGPRGGAIARTMSDDGSYVFFESPAALTPQALSDVPNSVDRTGRPFYAENVYEYHNGQVSLISDGKDISALGLCHPCSNAGSGGTLLGTSASGNDVFFRTADQLVPQDTDTQVDFYDARVDGGFPAPPEPAVCQGDGCQGTQSPPPLVESPSSATFVGPGNVAPTPTIPARKTAAQIRAEKLGKALKVCRAKHNKYKRSVCESQARKRYDPVKARRSGKATRRMM
jgi:hypothetical protein